MIDVVRADAGLVEAEPDGLDGGSAVSCFTRGEPLFLDRGDELAVDDERRRGVAVVRVDAEDAWSWWWLSGYLLMPFPRRPG